MSAEPLTDIARPKGAGGRPNAERAAQISRSIVTATIQAFSTNGTDFSMDRVALQAGVSKQAIYRRWPSKIDLLIHAIDTLLADDLGPETVDTLADPVESLRALAWRAFDKDQGQSHRLSIFLHTESLRDNRLQGRLRGWREQVNRVFRERLALIHADQQTRANDLELHADILMDLLSGATSKLAVNGKLSAADQRSAFDARWEMFLRMIAR